MSPESPRPERLVDRLREHYARQSASPETVARLARLTRDWERRRRRWRILGAAAAVLLVALGIATFLGERGSLARAVAEEIALNHVKDLEPEFRSTSFRPLAAAMTKLDFRLRPPHEAPAGLELRGARYCSIQGRLAVQLQGTDPARERVTLYVTSREGPLTRLGPSSSVVDGVVVELWSEGDLLYGLARSPLRGEAMASGAAR